MEPWIQRRASAIAHLGLGLSVLAASARKLGDFDLPWHLAIGRWVVQHRRALPGDVFSCTVPGRWAPYEYLSDVLLYGAFRASGTAGLQLFGAAFVALLAFVLTRHTGDGARRISPTIATVAVLVAAPWLVVRPAITSFAMLALTQWIARRHRDGAPAWTLLLWVPLVALWANLHAFAAVGPMLALAYAGYVTACTLARGRLGEWLPLRDGRDAGVAVAAALATVLAALASPFGYRIFLSPVIARRYGPSITEWARTDLALVTTTQPAIGAMMLLTALVALSALRRPMRRR